MASAKKQKKIGLALGGGGARGLAHLGVLRTLEEAGIPVHYIAGTSMGALVGGWYALSQDVEFLEDIFSGVSHIKLPAHELEQKDGRLFREKGLVEALELGFGNRKIESCQIPFAAIATDVKTGEEVVLDKGSLTDAIRASTAIPVVFSPVNVDSRLLIDGGFVNPVPADIVRQMGADVVIAVDVSKGWVDIRNYSVKEHDILHIISDAFSASEYQIAKRILKNNADVVIRPSVVHYDLFDFGSYREIVAAGKRATRYNIDAIAKITGRSIQLHKKLGERFIDALFNSTKDTETDG